MQEWYEIEEWVSGDVAIGGKGFWTSIEKDTNYKEIHGTYKKLVSEKRMVRIAYFEKEIVNFCTDKVKEK